MDLYYLGAETSQYMKYLTNNGITHVAISYYEWSRRHSTDDIFKHLPDDLDICITAGVSRKDEAQLDFAEFAVNYLEFCEFNAERALIYDMDAPAAPDSIRRNVRNALSILPNTVLFPFEGEDLEELANHYERIGVNSRTAKSHSVLNLRRVQGSLYGSNVTDFNVLTAGKFVATTTLMWLNPKRFGELWVFSRGRLVHYKAEDLAKAVRAHSDEITALSIDPEACAANDPETLVSLAIKSFEQMAKNVTKRPRDRRTAQVSGITSETAINDPATSDDPQPDTSRVIVPLLPRRRREQSTMPVISVTGSPSSQNVSSTNESLRQCDSCYLSRHCPSYEEGASCAFNIPVEIRTVAQREAACQVILEFQFQRVTEGRFAEQVEGNGPSNKVGQEMDRFYKLLTMLKEIETPIAVQSSGALSRMLSAIPAPELEGHLGNQEENDEEVNGYTELDAWPSSEEERSGANH